MQSSFSQCLRNLNLVYSSYKVHKKHAMKKNNFTSCLLKCMPGGRKKSRVKVASREVTSELVKPLHPTPDLNATVALSSLDQATAAYTVVSMTSMYSHEVDTEALKASLAQLLAFSPMFGGSLVASADGSIQVRLSDKGALFVEAESHNTLKELLPLTHGSHIDCLDVTPFYPKDAPSCILGYLGKDTPLFSIKLTKLADGGTCLSMLVPHILCDLGSAKAMLSAWSQVYQLVVTAKKQCGCVSKASETVFEKISGKVPAPIYGKEALEPYIAPHPPAVSSMFMLRKWSTVPRLIFKLLGAKWRWGSCNAVIFHVPKERLQKLKEEATAHLIKSVQEIDTGATPDWISTNDALVARIWQMLASMPCRKGKNLVSAVAINLRFRLSPPLPDTVIGNTVWAARFEVPNADTTPLGYLAVSMRQAIRDLSQEEIGQELAWLEANGGKGMVLPFMAKGAGDNCGAAGQVLITTWGLQLDTEQNFGGTPVLAQPQLLPQVPNIIFTLPAPDGDGVHVHFNLHEKACCQLKKAFDRM